MRRGLEGVDGVEVVEVACAGDVCSTPPIFWWG